MRRLLTLEEKKEYNKLPISINVIYEDGSTGYVDKPKLDIE